MNRVPGIPIKNRFEPFPYELYVESFDDPANLGNLFLESNYKKIVFQ